MAFHAPPHKKCCRILSRNPSLIASLGLSRCAHYCRYKRRTTHEQRLRAIRWNVYSTYKGEIPYRVRLTGDRKQPEGVDSPKLPILRLRDIFYTTRGRRVETILEQKIMKNDVPAIFQKGFTTR